MIVVVRTRQCLPMNTHKTRENNLQQPPENRSKYICKHGVNQCCETQLEGLAAMFIQKKTKIVQKKQNCTPLIHYWQFCLSLTLCLEFDNLI